MFFPPFVISPAFPCCRNISRLAFLCAPADENHKPLAILAEINSIAGTNIDLILENASAYTLDVGSSIYNRKGRRPYDSNDFVTTVK
jgi:hypothetical protein